MSSRESADMTDAINDKNLFLGSAIEYMLKDAGTISGVLWRTKNQTPDIEFDYRKMKIKVDPRGTAKLSGTLTFSDLEKIPRHSYVVLLQCGAPNPRGIVKWTGVRFADFAQALGVQPFAYYCRFVDSDAYFIEEDMKTLMHPQVALSWLLNDQPIPPQHGAPLRLIIPFRYAAPSTKRPSAWEFRLTSQANTAVHNLLSCAHIRVDFSQQLFFAEAGQCLSADFIQQ